MNSKCEAAWLIEQRGPAPMWLCGVLPPQISCAWETPAVYRFSNDSLAAIRFCRKEDAEAVRRIFMMVDRSLDLFVSEHEWITTPVPTPRAQMVTDEMVSAALTIWFGDEAEAEFFNKQQYAPEMRAAIEAALAREQK